MASYDLDLDDEGDVDVDVVDPVVVDTVVHSPPGAAVRTSHDAAAERRWHAPPKELVRRQRPQPQTIVLAAPPPQPQNQQLSLFSDLLAAMRSDDDETIGVLAMGACFVLAMALMMQATTTMLLVKRLGR